MPRKSRDSKVDDSVLLKPIDVTKFGGPEDPCFGKLYDLNEDACLMCGDHELCAIVFANKAHGNRIAWEKKNPTMDMRINGLELNKDIKEWVSQAKAKGLKGLKLRVKLKSRFHLNDEMINNYIKQ